MVPRRYWAAIAGTALWMTGCGSIPAQPDSVDVATTAVEKVAAEANTGPPSLAGSTWSLSRKPADGSSVTDDGTDGAPPGPYGGLLDGGGLTRPPVGERIFLVHFGDSGKMTEVTENRFFLAEFYGATIPIGVDWVGGRTPGLFFRSASYGVETDSAGGRRFGIAIVVHVRFLGIYLGQATLYSWGTIAEDKLDGQFGYLLDFTEGLVSFLGTVADQYPVEAEKFEE